MTQARCKAAAALVALACTVQIGAWFAWWQTAWVYDDQALWHFQWAVVTASLVAAAALSAPTEGYALWPRPPARKGPRCLRVGDTTSRVGLVALALIFVRVVSLHVWTTRTAWTWRGARADRLDALKWHAYQFGWDALVPMASLGVPAVQFSPPLRALGLSHEAGIAFHRVLGRATLMLASLHVALYLLVWGLEGGLEKVGDEVLSACHGSARVSHRPGALFSHECGAQAPSRNISNFYGLLAWCAGIVIGVASFYAVRRRSYALFMAAHQFQFAFWFFVVCHWPGILAFAAPSVVFIAADLARRRVAERTARCALFATYDGIMATVMIPMPGYSEAQLTGGVVRLRHRHISWMWHPFTIAGAVDGVAIVHVFDAGREKGWTHCLCRLAARQRVVELEVRGPLITPAAFSQRTLTVAQGRPTLVVAAGSGLAPAMAFLRAVRAAHPGARGAPHVRLVAICRTASQLECLDAFCLPATDCGTAEPWLAAELHLTRAPDAPATTHAVVEKPTRPSSGRVVVRRDGERMVAVAAAWPADVKTVTTTTASPLFVNDDETKEAEAAPASPVDLRRRRTAGGAAGGDDAVAVLAAGIGFLAAAYGVAWRADAPFAGRSPYVFDRRKDNNPNIVSGGLSLVVCAAAAFVGAALELVVAARVRRHGAYRGTLSDVELGGGSVSDGAAAEVIFATAGARPSLNDIVQRADALLGPDTDVLVGGPQRLIDGLEDSLGPGRMYERMTWAM